MSEIVKPTEVNGIESYISKDDEQTGLARPNGIPDASMRRILAEIVDYLDRQTSLVVDEDSTLSVASQYILSALDNAPSARPYLDTTGSSQAKVANAALIPAIVEYYAYEARQDRKSSF